MDARRKVDLSGPKKERVAVYSGIIFEAGCFFSLFGLFSSVSYT